MKMGLNIKLLMIGTHTEIPTRLSVSYREHGVHRIHSDVHIPQ